MPLSHWPSALPLDRLSPSPINLYGIRPIGLLSLISITSLQIKKNHVSLFSHTAGCCSPSLPPSSAGCSLPPAAEAPSAARGAHGDVRAAAVAELAAMRGVEASAAPLLSLPHRPAAPSHRRSRPHRRRAGLMAARGPRRRQSSRPCAGSRHRR
jgi:hypothetical protein